MDNNAFKPAVLLVIGFSLIALSACSQKEENQPDELTQKPDTTIEHRHTESSEPQPLTQAFIDQKVVAARGLVKTFATSLKSELQAAMKAGGPTNAISVCNNKAPQITRDISATQNMSIRRVSLKNRNVSNESIGWNKKMLESFQARLQSGEQIADLEHHEIVEINGKHEFRFMKAIPTGAVCLACHGNALNDEVSAKLKALYPNDKATGFSEGDIRGAFVVTEKFSLD